MGPKYRTIPTFLLEDADFIEAGSDVQAVLFLLSMSLDDHGRGQAHTGMLARRFNKESEVIECSLAALVELGILTLYQVGRHRYFQVCNWHEWQSNAKKTPSRYPPPPDDNAPGKSGEISGSLGKSREFTGNPGPKERKVKEQNRNEGEGEVETTDDPSSNVVPFPAGRTSDATASTTTRYNDEGTRPTPSQAQAPADDPIIREVARILRLPESPALARIVQEYEDDPLLSLLGEADAAREFIDNPGRNRNKQAMSPAFFRRWCKHEHEDTERRRAQRQVTAATGTTGRPTVAAPPGSARTTLPQSLMHLADQLPTRSAGSPGQTRSKGDSTR